MHFIQTREMTSYPNLVPTDRWQAASSSAEYRLTRNTHLPCGADYHRLGWVLKRWETQNRRLGVLTA